MSTNELVTAIKQVSDQKGLNTSIVLTKVESAVASAAPVSSGAAGGAELASVAPAVPFSSGAAGVVSAVAPAVSVTGGRVVALAVARVL